MENKDEVASKAANKFETSSAYRPHPRVVYSSNLPSRAKQSFAAECDINTIMKKYNKTGLIDHVNKYQGNYGELPDEVDYHANLNAVMAAKEAFASLTAEIRLRFGNDPAQFLAFVDDPENIDEMIALGLTTEGPPMPSEDDPVDVNPEDVADQPKGDTNAPEQPA